MNKNVKIILVLSAVLIAVILAGCVQEKVVPSAPIEVTLAISNAPALNETAEFKNKNTSTPTPVYPKPLPLNESYRIAPDSTAYLNILNESSPYYIFNKTSPYYGVELPKVKKVKIHTVSDSVVNPSPGLGYGTGMYDEYENRTWAVFAGQEVRPSLILPEAPPARTLYAPTLMCPNHCPFESVTVYYRYEGMSTLRAWGVWNWSRTEPPYWEVWKWMDSTFLDNYVRDYPEGKLYFVEIGFFDGEWKVLLWNFNTGKWEEQCSTTTTIPVDGMDFWDIWEYYFGGTCPPDLPDIESTCLQAAIDGEFRLVSETYGWEYDTMDCPYERRFIDRYYHWYVNPKNPPVAVAESVHRYNNVGDEYPCKALFDASASYDPDGIINYTWDFGDGYFGEGQTVEHVYSSYKWNGTGYEPFNVSLTVKDNEGLTNTTSLQVNVYIAGDANGDGIVDIFDAVIVGREWDSACTSGRWESERADMADLNNDCIVDIFDAVIVGANWDHTA